MERIPIWFLALILAFTSFASGGLHYSIAPILADGNPLAIARGINDSGDVLGQVANHADVLVHDSHATMLNDGSIPGISATALNNHDEIAGEYPRTDGLFAVRWERGQVHYLESPQTSDGYLKSQPFCINNRGEIAGWVREAGNFHAAVWIDGALVVLPDHGRSIANAINDAGDVVGFDTVGTQPARPTLWHNGVPQDILPNEKAGLATSINSAGVVAGSVGRGDDQIAFRWTNGKVDWLMPLAGQSSSWTLGLNDAGLVVGGSSAQGEQRAVVWQGSTALDLLSLLPNDFGWTSLEPLAINRGGAIVGSGLFNGQRMAFELTPATAAPLPSAIEACVVALPLWIVARRRAARV